MISRRPVLIGMIIAATAIGCALRLHAGSKEKAVSTQERPLGKNIRCLAFSPDGTFLAAAFGEPKQRGRVVLWDVAKQKELWVANFDDSVPTVVFAPDGKTIAMGNYDNTAKLLDTLTGKVLKVFEGHTNYVRAVAFTPDGKMLATGSWDSTVKVWDMATGTVRMTLDGVGNIFSLHYSPKGQWLVAGNGRVRIWEADTGKEKSVFGAESGPDGWMVFADESRFIAGCHDGTIRYCNIADAEQRVVYKHSVSRLAFSAKAGKLATNGGGGIEFFDFPPGEPTVKEKARIAELLVRFDDESYDVREAAGKEMMEIGIVAEPELRRAMKESPSAEVRIRCRRLREQIMEKPKASLTGHPSEVQGLAFSPDGETFASGGMDGIVRLWSVKDLKELGRLVPVGQ
jgi:WD40 repeat protein